MSAALPREGGIADQHDKRKQPSEICRLTSQRGVKPAKNSCLGSRFAIAFSVSKKGSWMRFRRARQVKHVHGIAHQTACLLTFSL